MSWALAAQALGEAAKTPDTGSAISSATGAPISWHQSEWNVGTGSAKVSGGAMPSWVWLAFAGVAAIFALKRKG